MTVLDAASYNAVRREIESRVRDYHGQPGADVDWLLAQLTARELRITELSGLLNTPGVAEPSPTAALREAANLRDRIRRLREAIRTVGRGGLDFVQRYTPHSKRGEPRPDSLPVPGAQAWVTEVLAKDDAEAARAEREEREG